MTATKFFSLALSVLLLMLSVVCQAQFLSGSDGSDGPLFIGSSSGTVTLDVPEPDGIFNFTTVTIQASSALMFKPNKLNTPVYMLATGDVDIEGTIDLRGGHGTDRVPRGGVGGPGGFAGGIGGLGPILPGAGHGPGGGGPEGKGVYAGPPIVVETGEVNGEVYGSPLLFPLIGGSGGGGMNGEPGAGGGGGGGALLIASSTQIRIGQTGFIVSQGGGPVQVAGSSGAVRLVADKILGSGLVDVTGFSAWGSPGRIRVDTIDRRDMLIRLRPNNPPTYSIGAFMKVFPDPLPKLALTHVAGKDIPEGTTEIVSVILPIDSPANQRVTVQARDFTGQVPVRVRLVPDTGSAINHDATIDMALGNPHSVDLNIDFPLNIPVDVEAFTR